MSACSSPKACGMLNCLAVSSAVSCFRLETGDDLEFIEDLQSWDVSVFGPSACPDDAYPYLSIDHDALP